MARRVTPEPKVSWVDLAIYAILVGSHRDELVAPRPAAPFQPTGIGFALCGSQLCFCYPELFTSGLELLPDLSIPAPVPDNVIWGDVVPGAVVGCGLSDNARVLFRLLDVEDTPSRPWPAAS